MTDLVGEVRATAARIASSARSVSIDMDAISRVEPADPPQLDPVRHYLEGDVDAVASYLLVLDTINFGSGWFPTLRKRVDPASGRPVSGYFTTAWALADRYRAHGPWTNAELRGMRTDELAVVLGQSADHELVALYAQALRQLGVFLGERPALELVQASGGSAVRLATTVSAGMSMWADHGAYKRAQILPSDLALAGVAKFDDLDCLTIFADNLVPHVLRCDGVLVYDDVLAAHIDGGELLPFGPWEREIRACAIHACEEIARRLGVAPRTLDNWLWNRGQAPEYKAKPRHRCRCVFY